MEKYYLFMELIKNFNENFLVEKLKIKISTQIFSSESEEKVRIALNNIFPNMNFKKIENSLIAESVSISDLYMFFLKINQQKILDAARNYVLSDINKGKELNQDVYQIILYLNKQIAFHDHVNFCNENESPLGSIEILIDIVKSKYESFINVFFPKYEWIKE